MILDQEKLDLRMNLKKKKEKKNKENILIKYFLNL